LEKTKQSIGMYADAKTWNPFKGCNFGCIYCGPSFQRQAKRQKQNCMDCYNYIPHYHPERLDRIPSSPIIFVCGNGDISFCDPVYTRKIISSIEAHNRRNPGKTYYFQSKQPEYFTQFLGELPGNIVLLTTLETNLETNRDQGYGEVSKAPPPSVRYGQFRALDWPRKVLTIEPILDFDFDIFVAWIMALGPEYVWLGFNSKPKAVSLPEPSQFKFDRLYEYLITKGLEVRLKDARQRFGGQKWLLDCIRRLTG